MEIGPFACYFHNFLGERPGERQRGTSPERDKTDAKKKKLSGAKIWARRILLMVLDAGCVYASYFMILTFRFGGAVPARFWTTFTNSFVYIILIYLLVNALFRLYSTLWEHAGVEELLYVVGASILSTVLCYGLAVLRMDRLPRSIYVAAGLMIIILHGGLRMFYRIYRRVVNNDLFSPGRIPVLVVGAGETGAIIIAQMQENRKSGLHPIGLVDDDPDKRGERIHGVRVMGSTTDIPAIVKRHNVKQIIYAIPSSDHAERQRIFNLCAATGCEMKIIPTVEAMLEGVNVRQLRDVDVGDLLPRAPVRLNTAAVSDYLTGATVLITGGGGSIGAELCRQAARFHPKRLIIFDIYENNAYELYMDLKRQYGEALAVEVVIGSVRDIPRLDETFARYKPDVVFHAAAHKHVPLMETSPIEAVKNNVNGTFNVAKAADIAGVKRFVLISTDKAVNPTNVMGATKYLCELIVQYMNQKSVHTDYVAVRFGNVLGSHGSVIPLFRRQIAAGGPVTVTHPDVTRYFMTIPEAAQLVIQAGSMAKQGEIFLLDMGEPVRIDDFARTFIRLCGYEPEVDIRIEYTGLRPGEKMYEELLQAEETQGESDFPGILIGCTHPLGALEIKRRIEYLRRMSEEDPENIRRYLAEVVPTYHAGEQALRAAEAEETIEAEQAQQGIREVGA